MFRLEWIVGVDALFNHTTSRILMMSVNSVNDFIAILDKLKEEFNEASLISP